MLLQNIIELNIDLDDNIEQILIVKEKQSLNAPFRLLIADYIQAFEHYQCTSQLETTATNLQNFNISLMDITGDSNLEIICTGYNNNDQQTLDIFKFDESSLASGISYFPIFKYASSGSIDISYDETRLPTPIEVQESDETSQDMIKKDIYQFSYLPTPSNPVGEYQFISSTQIPKIQFDDIKLRQVMDNPNIDSKFQLLAGQWLLESKKAKKYYLNFDYHNRSFCIYTNNEKNKNESTIENYNHIAIRKTLYNKVQIDGRNENHTFKLTSLRIVYLAMDTISVEIYDNDSSVARLKPNIDCSGTYRRIDNSHLMDLFSAQIPQNQQFPEINGIFLDQENNQYIFEYPYYKIKSTINVTTENGGYALYNTTVPIIEMVKFDQRRTIIEKRIYRLSHNVTKIDNKIFTALTLSEGKLSVHGFTQSNTPPLILEQKLILND